MARAVVSCAQGGVVLAAPRDATQRADADWWGGEERGCLDGPGLRVGRNAARHPAPGRYDPKFLPGPPPGRYDPKTMLGQDQTLSTKRTVPKYTMGRRDDVNKFQGSTDQVPGPNRYF